MIMLMVAVIDTNSKGEYYDPTGGPPFLRAYVNFILGHTTPFEYKKKDIPCEDLIAYSDPVLSHSMVWIRISHKDRRYA
jgi:hypothetical protein